MSDAVTNTSSASYGAVSRTSLQLIWQYIGNLSQVLRLYQLIAPKSLCQSVRQQVEYPSMTRNGVLLSLRLLLRCQPVAILASENCICELWSVMSQ
jgi:hypothetical protein